jgi:O-antigen ligase
MSRRFLFLLSAFLVALLSMGIPIEHKYDKLFRFFSLTLIPKELVLPSWFDKKIYFYISDLTALFLMFLSLFLFKVPFRRFYLEKGALFLWIVFICSIISIAVSPLSHYPIPYFRLLQLLTPILLYCFLSHTFSSEENVQIAHIFIVTLFAAASIEAVISIAQYLSQAPLGLRLLGEINSFSSFWHVNSNRWSLDYLFSSQKGPGLLIRPSGTFPHTNVLAGFLCISLLASYSLIPFFKRKIFFSLAFFLQFFAMAVTFSRSALFAWVIGTIIWLALHLWHNLRNRWNSTVCCMTYTIVFSFGITTALLYEQVLSRGGVLNYSQPAQHSDSLRLYYQKIALRMIKDRPLTGVGYTEGTLRSPEYVMPGEIPQELISAAHNIYLFLAAETGLISLGSFLMFLLILLRAALKVPFTDQINSLFTIFIAFLFIGMCDYYPIFFQQGKLLFFGFAGLLAAQSFSARINMPNEILCFRENKTD